MKQRHLSIPLFFLLSLFLFGCEQTTKMEYRIKTKRHNFMDRLYLKGVVHQLYSLDKEKFRDIVAQYRVYTDQERLLLVGFHEGPTGRISSDGYVRLMISPGTGSILSYNYSYCRDSVLLDNVLVQAIAEQVIELDLLSLKVDKFDNIYFRFSPIERYQYALIRDSTNSLKEYSYTKKFDNCYKLK